MKVVLVPYARAVMVRCAPAAEQYPPVGRARAVVDCVAIRGHALAALPSYGVPPFLREWLGENDEGVDGQDLAVQLAQPRQVCFPREHDRARRTSPESVMNFGLVPPS